MNFEAFGLSEVVMKGVHKAGYKTPTPIQQQAIPIVLKGHDLIGLAQTGTGKTAAFVLPMLEKLQQKNSESIRGLILAPTRELAQQIHETIETLCHVTSLRSIALYGGIKIQSQIRKLREGVNIIVACPGRLLDHVEQGTVRLSSIEILVLDEADQMFDMGFLPSIRKIIRLLPKKRQSLLFSATMPADIEKLASDILHQPQKVKVGHTAPATTVKQAVFPVTDNLKTELLIKILEHIDKKSVLVFTKTKHKAVKVARDLTLAGYDAASLQGNLSQNRRQATMEGFRNGRIQIIVATDLASRGIDVADISHVINYDMPSTVEAYTHRIGRTGRASKLGDAFSLMTRDDQLLVRKIEKILGAKLEHRRFDDFDHPKDFSFVSKPKVKHGRPRRQFKGRQ